MDSRMIAGTRLPKIGRNAPHPKANPLIIMKKQNGMSTATRRVASDARGSQSRVRRLRSGEQSLVLTGPAAAGRTTSRRLASDGGTLGRPVIGHC
jgi:hypothetical protein